MTNVADQFIALGNQLEAERNAAFDLWTWLPSHRVAEKYHTDHADNFTPSVKDILIEASMYIAHLRVPERPLSPEDKVWFSRCTCGDEEHVGAVGS